MVFPRPNRSPLVPSQRCGRGVVPAGRGVGVPARGVLRPARGQEAWEYHEPGPPHREKWPKKCLDNLSSQGLGIAILRACYRARKPQNPENMKKYKIPHPKIRKKYRKNTKTAQKRQFLGRFCIFSVFFPYFRGADPGWGILYFFRIFGILGFSGSVAGPRDGNLGTISDNFCKISGHFFTFCHDSVFLGCPMMCPLQP